MTKLTGPLMGFDAEGSIDKKTTFSKFKGVTYAKQYKAPKNPRTALQVLARDTLRKANLIWKQSSILFRESWNRAADNKVLTGYNIWIGRYIADNLGNPNLVDLTMAPTVLGGLAPAGIGLVAGSGSITVNFAAPTIPTGWTLESTVAGALINLPPNDPLFPLLTTGEATAPPGTVVLTGLTPGIVYVASGWIRWRLPNGRAAYGQSFQMQGIAPLP